MKKTVIAEAIEEMEEIDPDEQNGIEDDINTLGHEVVKSFETIENKLKMVEVLEGISFDAKHNKITPDQERYVRFALESVTWVDGDAKLSVLATEHIGNRIMEVLVGIWQNIHENIKKLLDYLQYSWTYFNFQGGRIRRIERALREGKSDFAHIRIGLNKHMEHGKHSEYVADMDEYMKAYRYFAETTGAFVTAAADLTEEDLGSVLRYYKEYLFGEPETFFRDQFMSLSRNLNKAKAAFKGKRTTSTSTYEEYASDVMLGVSTAVVRLPKENSYKHSDYQSIVDAQRYFYMYIRREKKVDVKKIFTGSIKLDVSRKNVEELLKLSDALLHKANELLKFSVMFSHFNTTLEANINKHREIEVTGDISDTVRGTRIYLRICSIIYDSVSTGYTLSLGNVKQALTICEKAVKQF